jgi:hypothetical protein
MIKMFLENQPTSDDNVKVERIAYKSKQYHLVDGILLLGSWQEALEY